MFFLYLNCYCLWRGLRLGMFMMQLGTVEIVR